MQPNWNKACTLLKPSLCRGKKTLHVGRQAAVKCTVCTPNLACSVAGQSFPQSQVNSNSQGGYPPALSYPPPPQQDWEASGGLSPSQHQAVQELSALGFDARQSQVWICSLTPQTV